MSKEIGIDKTAEKHACLECGEPFEWPEFSSYMLSLRTATIECLRCQTPNYKIVKKGLAYFIVLICALLVGLVLFLAINIPYMAARYDPDDGTTRLSFWFIAFGAFIGLGAARVIMNLYSWKTGLLSTDIIHKKY